jgi:hypothetical protein
MSAKPENKEQRKVAQTTPLEANMEPRLGEKKDTDKKDKAEAKSIEESKSNSPPEKRPHFSQQQKHSTGVAAPISTTTAVPPLASTSNPLWKGITGMISNTVSKVFGASREESESESDTGEPSQSHVTPAPAPPQPAPPQLLQTATKRDVPVQDERELKRARHEAARAYALGLGEEERAYYASTVDTNTQVPVQHKPETKPKRKVFTAPKTAQPLPQPHPKSDTDRHYAARAFALSGGNAAPSVNNQNPNQSQSQTDNNTKDVATGKNHPHPGIIWPPPTRLLNLKLDDFAKRAGQSPGTQPQVVPVPIPIPIPAPKKVKPPQTPPRVRAPNAAFADGDIVASLKKQVAAATAQPAQPVKKRKYKHGGAVVPEKKPVSRRPSLTVTTVYKEPSAKSTVIASTGAAVMDKGNGAAPLAPTIPPPRRDQAPVFPTTLKTQVMSAASTVARSLNLGPWPSPFLSLDAAGAVENKSANSTKLSASSLHSQHMSVVAASIQQFAYDVILRSMELEIPDKANESKAFLGTMLILREVLTQNGEGIFGSVASLVEDDDSKDGSYGDETNQEAKILSHQVLATSVILAGLEAFQGPWSEKLSTDFLCMIDGYDNDSDEVAEYMVAVDQSTAVTLSGGREMSVEERLAWQLSTNLHRDDHPVIKRKREIENAETSWKARKIEVALPNACHISILEEACRD